MQPKTGTCSDCGKEGPVVGKPRRCQRCYWSARAKASATRPAALSYKAKRAEFMARPENKFCRAKLDGCARVATECHHLKGRHENIDNEEFFLAVCHGCHVKITEMPKAEAFDLGLRVSRLGK